MGVGGREYYVFYAAEIYSDSTNPQFDVCSIIVGSTLCRSGRRHSLYFFCDHICLFPVPIFYVNSLPSDTPCHDVTRAAYVTLHQVQLYKYKERSNPPTTLQKPQTRCLLPPPPPLLRGPREQPLLRQHLLLPPPPPPPLLQYPAPSHRCPSRLGSQPRMCEHRTDRTQAQWSRSSSRSGRNQHERRCWADWADGSTA